MNLILEILNNFWAVYLETAFWLLLGLLLAGFIKLFSDRWRLEKWLGGNSFFTIVKAALIGAPLPLCSCGVLPTAIALRRAGASRESTVAFLVSTPETGVDSVAVSYSLLGPFMALVRPIAAVTTAIFAGLLVRLAPQVEIAVVNDEPHCCADHDEPEAAKPSIRAGLRFAFVDLLADIAGWLIVGLLAAAIILTFIEPGALAQWGQGPLAMLVMLFIGVPMYVCATASTPIAAALLIAGVSPGVAMVFLLAGPATNIAGLMVLRKELGAAVVGLYLLAIVVCSFIVGLLVDSVLSGYFNLSDVVLGEAHIIPHWLALAAAIILLPGLLWPQIKKFFK